LHVDAFDSDVLIYAARADHPLGQPVRALLLADGAAGDAPPTRIGSTLLLPELLVKPLCNDDGVEIRELSVLLGRLVLQPVDEAVAQLAVALGATYGLRAADAVHLATAVNAGAERFITNNARDFPKSIAEIDICYPADLEG